MITITIILAAITLGFFGFTSVSVPKNGNNEALNRLSCILDKLFLSTPLENLMGEEKESQLTVRFRVNDNYEMTNLRIHDGNDELVKYVYGKLSEEASRFVSDMEPSNYDVKLKFVLR